jgi:phenylalanyl-tRNA synthetase alpha chain
MKSKQKSTHPISAAIEETVSIFTEMGFEMAEGPELEDAHHNFDILNVPKDHPARDMHDTFWLPDGRLLRTQVTAATARYLETHTPPLQVFDVGRVYRNETTDMTHEAQFYQVDGFVVGKDISLANLKWTLETWFEKFFKGSVDIRFRPGFFPFVEPGVEVDMRLNGDNVPEKLRGKWIEILGAGMLHPKVLENVGIDPKEYQGFAFGGGVERLTMLKWAIDDMRLFYKSDLRFVDQFKIKEE